THLPLTGSSAGLDLAIPNLPPLASVNFGGWPPAHLGYTQPNPSALRFRITPRTPVYARALRNVGLSGTGSQCARGGGDAELRLAECACRPPCRKCRDLADLPSSPPLRSLRCCAANRSSLGIHSGSGPPPRRRLYTHSNRPTACLGS